MLADSWTRCRKAISIDNFIDCHSPDEPKIAVCGKLAITRAILAAEAKSLLAVDLRDFRAKLDFSRSIDSWFNGFFQLLTENCRIDAVPDRLRSVGVISFNYDRCLEHYLFYAIQNYYGVITAEKSAELLQHLEIHHPYVAWSANLPWMHGRTSIGFGVELDARELIPASQQIRTFSEGTDPSVSDINAIRSSIAGAKRLIFLGFAFHRLNIDLLFNTTLSGKGGNERIFGTALGISQSDCDAIVEELSESSRCPKDSIKLRQGLTCAKLIQEHSRGLSLVG